MPLTPGTGAPRGSYFAVCQKEDSKSSITPHRPALISAATPMPGSECHGTPVRLEGASRQHKPRLELLKWPLNTPAPNVMVPSPLMRERWGGVTRCGEFDGCSPHPRLPPSRGKGSKA